MNIRLNIILVVIVAILAGWYYSQQTSISELDNLIKREGEPEYTGRKITTSAYDLKGNPQYFAQAQEIKRYESIQKTEFFKPLLDLFDPESTLRQWKIEADSAEITKDNILNLHGNVRISSFDSTSRLQRIETDFLRVDLNTQDIFSDSIVKSVGMGFITTGTGLTGNLKKQNATLTKNVKTYIEPNFIKETESNLDLLNKDTQ